MTPDSRRRAVLVATAAFALSAVAGLGLLLLLRGTDSTAPVATVTTPASTSASPSTTPSASPASTPSPSPSPPAPAVALDGAFLSPEQADAAESPGWSVDEAYEPVPGPVYDPCQQGAPPQEEAVVASAERAMGSSRETGGSSLTQELYGYADEQAASAAFDAYADATAQCPTGDVPDTDGDTVERTVLPVADDRYLVRERYCNPECTGIYASYTLVARSGRALTVAAFSQGEDGEPEDAARSLLDAAAEQLAAAVPS